jgi:predicted MPP superfamily phosphohydrolase
MQGYVLWRASSVPFVKERVSFKVLIVAGFVLWISFFLGSIASADSMGLLAAPLEFWAMAWLAMLFLTSVAMLAVDVTTGFGTWMKLAVPRLRGAALVCGGLLSAIALFQGLRPPIVSTYEVTIQNLPVGLNGMVIVGLSDLHLGSLLGPHWLAERVSQVSAERPDLVVFIGDVFEGHSAPPPELLTAFQRLTPPLGVWGVLGNHEFHSVSKDKATFFESAGIHILRNTWAELRPGLVIAGLDDAPQGTDSAAKATPLSATLARRPPGALLLLSHTPLPSETIAGAGVDLMLSGHTHGGQIWPFGYLVKMQFPLFEGRYEFGTSTAIVSRGAGTWGPRMRLWKPAEILRITLRSGKASEALAATIKHSETN